MLGVSRDNDQVSALDIALFPSYDGFASARSEEEVLVDFVHLYKLEYDSALQLYSVIVVLRLYSLPPRCRRQQAQS